MPGPVEEGDKFTVCITFRVTKIHADFEKFKEACRKFATEWKADISANTVVKKSS
jgi:hypothetical protein